MRARMTSRGRITIPKPLREVIGIGPGSEVDFFEENGQCYMQPRDPAAQKRLAALAKIVRCSRKRDS
jgi:AbrB family looped-hinge helix DNA binding protein